MSLGNFKIRVRRRRNGIQITRLKRLSSGAYVRAAHVTLENRDLSKQPFTLAELAERDILPSQPTAPE